MSYRVCIPAAGIGSRLGGLTKFLNKSLVGIANRPALCHLVEQFPPGTEFVVALGHKGDLVREFVSLAYPDRKFIFCDVSPFEGPGSGLGLSLQTCKNFLQQPFVFISCDTLVKEPIAAPDGNWMGYADVADISSYRTIAVNEGSVVEICEKGHGASDRSHAYIGLAGIDDYEAFWRAMAEGGSEAVQTGEAHGLRSVLARGVKAHNFTWYDTGNPEALARARDVYREPSAPNILEKANEAIWFVGNTVIKFSDDKKFIANRVKRVGELEGFVPDVTGQTLHMYRYPKVAGKVLSEVITLPMFERLLEYCQQFWTKKTLSCTESQTFNKACMRFYREKTLERIDLFYRNFSRSDGSEALNGIPMPSLSSLLSRLDWDWLADGLPGRFHGDFHFENILWNDAERKFTFLDWRQDFGGDLSTGDVYYDLAKLLHGLIICHELIAADNYSVDWQVDNIAFDFHRKQILVECEQYYLKWLVDQGYDRKKVIVLTALIYLNIAALHHYPYSLLLYALGKKMLVNEMK